MKRFRNSFKVLIVIFCILSVFPAAVSADTAEEEKASDKFETKVSYGFNKYYKRSRGFLVPIKIELKNNWESIEGEVQLLFEKDRYDQKTLYEAYTQELDLAKGASKTIEIDAAIGERRQALLKVADKEGKIIFEQKINFERGDNFNSTTVGILSDDYDSLSFLGLVNLKDEASTKDKKMVSIADLKDAFPQKKELLKSLDIILINDYDTQNLDKKQIEALKGYIKDGGSLIIGTGSKYQKSLKGLGDLNYFNPSDTLNIKGYGGVLLAAGEADEAEVLLKEGETPVAYRQKVEKGSTIILGFDLAEDKFLNWEDKNTFMKKIILDNTTLIEEQEDMGYEEYNMLQDMISYIPNEKGINAKNIILIILVFLLAVGPVNYLVLKKLDKSELSWITIPIISLAFTLAIYVAGLGTKFDEPLANNAAIIELNSKGEVEDSLIATGLFAFKEGNLNIAFKENTSVNLMDDMHINEMKYKDKDIVTKYISGDNKRIEFMKMGKWESKTIESSQKIDDINIIAEEFKADDKGIKGKIKNNSDLNLKEAVLIYGGNYHILGDIDKKFSKEIAIDAAELRKSRSGYRIYEIADNIYPWTDDMFKEKSLLSKAAKQNMLQQGLFEYLQEDKDMAVIVAYSTDTIVNDIEMNGKSPNRLDRNLIMIPIDFTFKTGEKVEITEGVLRPKIESINNLNMDPYGGEIYGDGDVTYSLKLDNTIDIKSMSITNSSSPDIMIYMHNYDSDKWEEMDKSTITLDEAAVKTYYKDGIGLKMKFQASPGKDNTISAPLFTVKGVGK